MIAAISRACLDAFGATAEDCAISAPRLSLFKLLRLLCFTCTCLRLLCLVGQDGILLAGCQPASLGSDALPKAPIANRRAGFQPAPHYFQVAVKMLNS